jgi:hypothetical protein
MPSNLKLSTAARNAANNGVTGLLNGGRVEIRTGSPPTNLTDASSGTLLATLTLNATAAGASSGGTATFNAITNDSSADASGDAGYFRVYASGGGDTAAIFQGTAGEAADTPDLTFDEKTFVAGGIVSISSLTFSVPIQ